MHLFALVRGMAPRVHRVSLAQPLQAQIDSLFKVQALAFLKDTTAIEFDARHSPESDEIHFIEPYTDNEDFLGAHARALACPMFDVADEMLQKLTGLFVVTEINGVRSACFQTFDRRHALTADKWTIIKIGTGFKRLDQQGFMLDGHLAAILQGGRLLFRKFQVASRLFDLTDYFHEATDAELKEFAQIKAVSIGNVGEFLKLADTARVRKQIAIVLSSSILKNCSVTKIVARAKTVAPGLHIGTAGKGRNTKIVLPENRSDLKDLLDLLQENFYKGCLTDTQYVANSKRTVLAR